MSAHTGAGSASSPNRETLASRRSSSRPAGAAGEGPSPRLELLRELHVAPSILSADFGRLREQVGEVLAAGARVIHVDVMDGHFVPPITVGPLIVASLAEQVGAVDGLIDVHLMIERPERHVQEFVRAGAGSVTVHAEATPHVAYAVDRVRDGGAGVGVAINPGTPAEALTDLGGAIDLALCMTVNPGWGGQAFIEHSLSKLPRVRALVSRPAAVQVDGGIDPHTAPRCRDAGANLFVAGSAIFDSPEPGEAYAAIVRALAG
jgi:ribulose-phosphate 3-epimerase